MLMLSHAFFTKHNIGVLTGSSQFLPDLIQVMQVAVHIVWISSSDSMLRK